MISLLMVPLRAGKNASTKCACKDKDQENRVEPMKKILKNYYPYVKE